MTTDSTIVAIVSGVREAAPPAAEALRRELPDAVIWNLVDDRLISEAVREDAVTPRLQARFGRLVEHALAEGADAVLITCSMYAFLVDGLATRLGVAVVAPDEAAMVAAVHAGYRSIAVVSGVPLALRDSCSRLAAVLDARGSRTRVVPVLATAARAPSLGHRVQETVDRLAEVVETAAETPDAVFLANYTLAFAAEGLAARLGLPVLSGPAPAAAALRAALERVPSVEPSRQGRI